MRLLFFLGLCALACGRSVGAKPESVARASGENPARIGPSSERHGKTDAGRARTAAPAAASASPAPRVDRRSSYAWLASSKLDVPRATDSLAERFAPPNGFERVEVEHGSLAEWLRHLPMAPPGTPVRTYRGAVLHRADHPNIAGVVAIDVGKADLQQCADAVVRMHAEWKWSNGDREMTYRSASGVAMPLGRWMRGERPVPAAKTIRWRPRAGAMKRDDHESFRSYLDQVFAWANTVSIAKQATPVSVERLRAGDFVILPGNPGHAVLVLEVARAGDGRRKVLLGQSFMPAQSFQVLRDRRGQTWYDVDPTRDLETPFWPPFPWSSLRRLD